MKLMPIFSSLIVCSAAVARADREPADVVNADQSLTEMEKYLQDKHYDRYSSRRAEVERNLLVEPSAEMKTSPRFASLKQRLTALDAKLVKAAGGHASEIWGDGTRTAKISKNGLEAAHAAISACKSAQSASLSDLPASYKKYEEKLARVKKIDASALHFAGLDGDSPFTLDIPLELVTCEAMIARSRNAQEDHLDAATPQRKKYTACGYTEWTFEAPRLGNKFGAFQLAGVPAENGFPMDCKKLPKSGRIPANLKAAALAEFQLAKGDVLALEGALSTEQRGNEVWELATVRLYSTTTELSTGDCGEVDPKLVCAGSGSNTAATYDEISHALKRAATHKGKDADNCVDLLKQAYASGEKWQDFYTDAKKSGDWKSGLKYKTADDGVLTETQITTKIKALAAKADENSRTGYCEK